MNKFILIVILVLISFVAKAQEIPYEKLDSISESVSKLQLPKAFGFVAKTS